jgi:hypothetical protein
MTLKNLLAAGIAAAVALGATACDSDKLTELNRNPNSPTDAPSGALFTNSTRLVAARFHGVTYDLRGTEFIAQHLAEVQYPDDDRYARLTAGFLTATFDAPYANELEDYQQIVRRGLAEDQPGIYGPAMVMKTLVFGYLTDSWGDIPYFNALQGDSATGVLQASYDAQQDIYADFFTVLAKVSADLEATTSVASLGAADPLYSGDFTQWQRFANSLRARHAMRLANVDANKARTEFQAAMAAPGGLFQSNADNATFVWPGDGVYNNPWADNFKTRDDQRLSNRLIDEMASHNDPRIPMYAQPTEADPTRFAGMPNALTHDSAGLYLTTASRPGAAFYPGATSYGNFGGSGASFPSFFMTYAEVAFLKAEAAERGWIPGGSAAAAVFYGDGIRASMEQWGVSSGAITTYLAQPSVQYAGGVAGLKQIAIQKWVALFSDGGQAWAEFRRTCQPATVKPGPEAIFDEVPRRFQYSITENAVNEAAVQAAVARQGEDEMTTAVYWDTNRTSAPTYEAGCGVK